MAHGLRIPASASGLSQLAANVAARAERTSNSSAANALTLFTGTSASATTLTATLNLTRRASLHGTWQGQKQAVSAFLPSRFEQHNARFEWRFRMATVEAQYYLIRFDVGNPIFRKLVVFKITRDFTFSEDHHETKGIQRKPVANRC